MSIAKLFHNKLVALFPRAEFVEAVEAVVQSDQLPYTFIPPDREWVYIEYAPTQINIYIGEQDTPFYSVLLSDPELDQKLHKALADAIAIAMNPDPNVNVFESQHDMSGDSDCWDGMEGRD